MHPDARALLADRTSRGTEWQRDELLSAKALVGVSVSVILPALNEERTVGPIVSGIRRAFMEGPGPHLVDELMVLDSGSDDDTAKIAVSAGAQVIHRNAVLPRIAAVAGKGEAMWRAVAATTGDLVVFIDADLLSFSAGYVTGLLGPLLATPSVQLVKAVYERPLVQGGEVSAAGGGRVTELVARPLLNLYWPQLAGVIQPLAGEYAARRSLLEQLAFPCGYGVDFALLVGTADLAGVSAIAQVDLGVRLHRHHDEQRLGRMSAEILQTAWSRLHDDGNQLADGKIGTSLLQFEHTPVGYSVRSHDVSGLERPPLESVPEYRLTRVAGALP